MQEESDTDLEDQLSHEYQPFEFIPQGLDHKYEIPNNDKSFQFIPKGFDCKDELQDNDELLESSSEIFDKKPVQRWRSKAVSDSSISEESSSKDGLQDNNELFGISPESFNEKPIRSRGSKRKSDRPIYEELLSEKNPCKKARHASAEEIEVSKQPESLTISKDPFLCYVHPQWIRQYIIGYTNPVGDGNCGYRSVAAGLGKNEKDWVEIKKDMVKELERNRETYSQKNYSGSVFYKHSFEKFRDLLEDTDSPVGKERWLEFPAHAYILANAYQRPIILFSALQPLTFFPTLHPPNDNKPIFICLLNALNHFISVDLLPHFPAPPLYPPWNINRRQEADTWVDKFQKNLDFGQKLFNSGVKESTNSSRVPLVIGDSD
ncbi:uncharacterized protein MELLADRAFT_63196 [Melampsora larici-populina 98AG31]|uniref:OTU domain-containing protein n=1 Tax=Melampsora larici-populina (strain 98AG31 / pathotype 3-4-7) TaxID=747676 RepID=F4RLS7_MELLP|nr:uncharacterized protein MELLADRAFT_63196 [Melampsora larici-populina 98AG31]EGG06590.1 hypothetical protein MELLADRAFT_63196 [Melampsora larici-populina 98AG31]